MRIETRIRRDIAAIEPYDPPDLKEIAAQAGVAVEDLIRLNANENAFGPSPRVAQALAACATYGCYPDDRGLRAAVAAYTGVQPEQVLLGNGSNELIDLTMRLVLQEGEGVLISPPTFSMYRFFARLNHRPVHTAPRGPNWTVDPTAIEVRIQQTEERRIGLLYLPSPGNPDGQAIPLAVVERLLALPLIVVLDEAYVEFGGATALPLLARYDNLVILRSFSKWAGLAGLRVGYALMAPTLARYARRVCPPFTVNAAAAAAVQATLEDLEAVQANVKRLVVERERLRRALQRQPGIDPLPSQANFLLCRVRGGGGKLAAALARRGILMRCFSDSALADYVRITVGRPEQNQALLQALKEIHGIRIDEPAADSRERRHHA